jgi:hypothetical protein
LLLTKLNGIVGSVLVDNRATTETALIVNIIERSHLTQRNTTKRLIKRHQPRIIAVAIAANTLDIAQQCLIAMTDLNARSSLAWHAADPRGALDAQFARRQPSMLPTFRHEHVAVGASLAHVIRLWLTTFVFLAKV